MNRRGSYHIVFALGLALVLSACSAGRETSLSDVTLVTDKRSYNSGDEIRVTLRNESERSRGYNLCAAILQRRDGDTWVPISEDRVCTTDLKMLPAGGEDSSGRDLPKDLDTGNYRLSLEIEPGPDRDQVTSNEFRVTK